MSLKVGDKVRLKTDGPDMTIISSTFGTGFICGWFDGDKFCQSPALPPEALVPVVEENNP